MAPVASKGVPFINPQSFKYLIILIALRGGIKRKIPTWVEHAAYYLALEPMMLVLMHTDFTKRFTQKYRSFLDRNTYPSNGREYDVIRSCKVLHPNHDSCRAAYLEETPIIFKSLASLYFKFYVLQYAISLGFNIFKTLTKKSPLTSTNATSLLNLRRIDSTIEMRAVNDARSKQSVTTGLPPKTDHSDRKSGTSILRRPGVLSMTRNPADIPVSPSKLPPATSLAAEDEVNAGGYDDGTPQVEGDNSLKKKPLTMQQVVTKEVMEFGEGWARSTGFLFLNMAIHRAGFCALLTYAGESHKHKFLYYLVSMAGASAVVLERHSRVSIINRMLATLLIAEGLPGKTWKQVLPYSASLIPLALAGRLNTWVVLSGLLSALMM